jgi:hypothetical protein
VFRNLVAYYAISFVAVIRKRKSGYEFLSVTTAGEEVIHYLSDSRHLLSRADT